jgi:hypothetical protein
VSVIGKLLGFIGLPQWALELLALATVGVVVSVGYRHIELKGRAQELAVITAASKIDHNKLQAGVTAAESSRDKTLKDLDSYRADHPDQPVQLCLDPTVQARTPPSGPNTGGSRSRPSAVQPVPAGDSGGGPRRVGPDIFGMLDALAARADQLNADRTALAAIVLPLTK